MKTLKLKFPSIALSYGNVIVPMVLVLAFWCVNTEVEAQTYSELDGSTLEMLEQAFEEEKSVVIEEINDQQSSVSPMINRNIYHYYESVLTLFRQGDLELREAFVNNLVVLQRGPVLNYDLTQALFTDRLTDGNSSLRMVMGGEAPLTSSFSEILLEIEVTTGDISTVVDLFEFISSSK